LYCSGQKYWAEVDNNFLKGKMTEIEIERNSPLKEVGKCGLFELNIRQFDVE